MVPKSSETIEEWVRGKVNQERYQHILGVVDTAVLLARRWGITEEEAYLAALLHDCLRDVPKIALLKMADKFGIVGDDLYQRHPLLLHGPVAAWEVQIRFSVSNQVFDSIFYHTTGRKGMGTLEKIVYVADAIEPNRNYARVEELRDLAFNDLDQAVLHCLSHSILYVVSKGHALHYHTVEARNALLFTGERAS